MTSKELYFGQDVDDAIAQFLKETHPRVRSKIFEEKIYPAFEKLAQYHYYNWPLYRNPEVISECIVHLYEQIHKFDPSKGSRGFPYFNMIALHFFIGKMKAQKRMVLQEQDVSLTEVANNNELFAEDFEEKIESDQFVDIFKKHLPLWRDKFTKTHEKQIVDALIKLFDDAESIDIMKKKALFVYLKEITQMNSKQIAINLNKIKKKFLFLKSKYDRGDF